MGPNSVIKPMLAPWLGLGGNDFFDFSPMVMLSPFFKGQSSFSSLFHLSVPLMMPLGADEETPSFSFLFLFAVAAFTKALCFVASISVKDKKRMLSRKTPVKTTRRKETKIVLTPTGVRF